MTGLIRKLATKALIFFVILGLVTISLPGLVYPKQINAQGVPVNDLPAEGNLGTQTSLGFWQKVQKYWELYVRPALRDMAAKRLTDYITQQTLDWINNGTQPTFVGNWSQLTKDAGNIAFDSVNNYLKTDGVDLCSPFVPQIQIMLQGTFMQSQPISCSIDNFLTNISNSTDMLKRGDWLTYSQAIMPENNPMGLYLISENRIYSEYLSQQTARVNEAVASSGFLGTKTCTSYGSYGSVDEIQTMCKDSGHKNDPICSSNPSVNTACQQWEVQTPGDVAGKAVANAITSDTLWSANIQNFTSAVINALVSKVFQKGLASLQSSSINTDSDLAQGADPNVIANFNSVSRDWLNTYDDTIYYLNSTDYPTLQTWLDVQSLAQQGISSCSSTTEWQQEYNNVTTIVNVLQNMTNAANEGITNINQVDPAALSSAELSQQITLLSSDFSNFSSTYGILLDEISSAKSSGSMTRTQTVGLQEKNSLTTDLSPAPACISPLTSQ